MEKARSENITWYLLEFHRSDTPPDADTEVLCTDGESVGAGYYDDSLDPPWRHSVSGWPWPGVRAWADLPDPDECMIDCYPECVREMSRWRSD